MPTYVTGSFGKLINSIIKPICYIPVNQFLKQCQIKGTKSHINLILSLVFTTISNIYNVLMALEIISTNERTKGNWPNIL